MVGQNVQQSVEQKVVVEVEVECVVVVEVVVDMLQVIGLVVVLLLKMGGEWYVYCGILVGEEFIVDGVKYVKVVGLVGKFKK